mmetsp:Transcript_27136/g.68379  ORF Transcript_27136/g.68379 Transcript_27136/m.68379 type:complete len:276 (-) Transcript_27136:586-1413(-)
MRLLELHLSPITARLPGLCPTPSGPAERPPRCRDLKPPQRWQSPPQPEMLGIPESGRAGGPIACQGTAAVAQRSPAHLGAVSAPDTPAPAAGSMLGAPPLASSAESGLESQPAERGRPTLAKVMTGSKGPWGAPKAPRIAPAALRPGPCRAAPAPCQGCCATARREGARVARCRWKSSARCRWTSHWMTKCQTWGQRGGDWLSSNSEVAPQEEQRSRGPPDTLGSSQRHSVTTLPLLHSIAREEESEQQRVARGRIPPAHAQEPHSKAVPTPPAY